MSDWPRQLLFTSPASLGGGRLCRWQTPHRLLPAPQLQVVAHPGPGQGSAPPPGVGPHPLPGGPGGALGGWGSGHLSSCPLGQRGICPSFRYPSSLT